MSKNTIFKFLLSKKIYIFFIMIFIGVLLLTFGGEEKKSDKNNANHQSHVKYCAWEELSHHGLTGKLGELNVEFLGIHSAQHSCTRNNVTREGCRERKIKACINCEQYNVNKGEYGYEKKICTSGIISAFVFHFHRDLLSLHIKSHKFVSYANFITVIIHYFVPFVNPFLLIASYFFIFKKICLLLLLKRNLCDKI